ncbi:MAG: hypothetical protein ACP5ID_01640 [Conexivisphaera sp.]
MGLDCGGVQRLGDSLSRYCDPAVRSILRTLLGGSALTARQISEKSGVKNAEDLLAQLSSVLRVSGVAYRAVAPRTGDSEFYARLSCPFCGSQDLRREELVEHTGCGYVGRLSDFRGKDGSMRCPRCGSPVDAQSLRSIGFWYQCNSCHQTFPRPNLSLVGAASGKEISPEELEPVKEVSYSVSEELEPVISGLLELIEELASAASSKGYAFGEPFRLRGKSGVEHVFCSSLDGNGSRVLLDLVLCGDSPRVLRYVTKAFDASSEFPVILMMAPEVEDAALKMLMSAALSGLRVKVLATHDPSDLPALLARALEEGFPAAPDRGQLRLGVQATPDRQ